MKTKNRKQLILLFILFVFIGFINKIQAQTITVTGSWVLTIGLLDLQGGAGSDFNPTYESAVDQIEIDIKDAAKINWRVDVSKIDINWDSRMILSVKRTGGGKEITGGTVYQEVTDTDQEFFRGSKNNNNIPVQLQLDGMTVEIQQDTYTTTIYYTVMEI